MGNKNRRLPRVNPLLSSRNKEGYIQQIGAVNLVSVSIETNCWSPFLFEPKFKGTRAFHFSAFPEWPKRLMLFATANKGLRRCHTCVYIYACTWNWILSGLISPCFVGLCSCYWPSTLGLKTAMGLISESMWWILLTHLNFVMKPHFLES